MISKEELLDELREWTDGDLSDGTCAYLADHLLEKFVVVKRQLSNADVAVSEDGWVTVNGGSVALLSRDTHKDVSNSLDGRDGRALERSALRYETLELAANFMRERENEAKVERSEELTKEIGGDTFDELPPMIQKLVVRLVEAEFTNARD